MTTRHPVYFNSVTGFPGCVCHQFVWNEDVGGGGGGRWKRDAKEWLVSFLVVRCCHQLDTYIIIVLNDFHSELLLFVTQSCLLKMNFFCLCSARSLKGSSITRGLNATRSPSLRAPSQPSGPSLSPSFLLEAFLRPSLLDSLSIALEGNRSTSNTVAQSPQNVRHLI